MNSLVHHDPQTHLLKKEERSYACSIQACHIENFDNYFFWFFLTTSDWITCFLKYVRLKVAVIKKEVVYVVTRYFPINSLKGTLLCLDWLCHFCNFVVIVYFKVFRLFWVKHSIVHHEVGSLLCFLMHSLRDSLFCLTLAYFYY